MRLRHSLWLLGAGLLTLAGATFAAGPQGLPGENPNPVHLVRPRAAPLSAMAQLGRQIFYDANLSSSGQLSCVSCHSPQHAYGPPNEGPVMLGGPKLSSQGARAVPSLEYLERQPPFSIGPDNPEVENVNLLQMAAQGQTAARSRDGLPPLLTDHQYEALGAPRNLALAVNKDPGYFDLGICGPARTDMATQTQYCGMFLTPTLRNTTTRRVFFHNGVFRTLQQVLDFYNFRDTDPQKVYPHGADGTVRKYDDVPARFQANIDVADPPFDRHLGETPAMTAQDESDIIAFLQTLTDGYKPGLVDQ
jgi:cytochrome c peroxidase